MRDVTLHNVGFGNVTTMREATDGLVIVGAGFSGLAMGAKLKRAGREDFVIIERAGDVGGVWRDNTYPGAACDVPSHVYSLSFAQNPELVAHLLAPAGDPRLPAAASPATRTCCATSLRHASSSTRAGTATHWDVDTSQGTITARALVAAAGPLVEPKLPDVPGLVDFPGEVFHSARWDHDADLTGKRVAVVGTGASRDPVHPGDRRPGRPHDRLPAHGAVGAPAHRAADHPRRARALQARARRPGRRPQGRLLAARARRRRRRCVHPRKPSILAAIGKAHLRSQVADPELRDKLTPRYEPGCKRLLLSNTYYPALAQPHVDVVASGLTEVRGSTVVGADGSSREVDVIIFGTGFEVTRPPVGAPHPRPRGHQPRPSTGAAA